MTDIPATEKIPFGEWLPDMGDFDAGGALMVKNCIPYGDKYKPFYDLKTTTDALPAECRGAFAYRDAAGTVTIFAGTSTKLYKLSGTSWVDVTRLSGGDYTLGADNFWCFVAFGTKVYATSYTDDIQVFDLATDTDFSLLSATAPRCRWMAVIDNFLMCVDTVDGDGALGFRAKWSPINDPSGDWTPAPTTTQSDIQDIYDSVYSNTYITPFGDYGVIVQGRALWRVDYVGGELIFDFNRIDNGRGSILSRSCTYNGQSIFLLAEDGFYEFNGGEMIPIGDKKIDQYFYENFDESYDYNLNCSVDPVRKMVIWAVPHIGSAGGKCNFLYCFSWVDRRWTIIEQEVQNLFSFISLGYTLEELDAISSSLDALQFSLDSRAWTGGKTTLGGFSYDFKLGLFTGDQKTATFQTGEVRLNPSGRAQVTSIIPYVDGGTTTGRLGTRNLLDESVAWTASVSKNTYTGELDYNVDSVYQRAEVTVTGNWTTAHGVGIRQQEGGKA